MIATFTTGLMGSGKSKTLIEKFKDDKTLCIAFSAKLEEETGTLGTIESRNGQLIFSVNINANQPEKVIKLVKTYFSVKELETIYIDEVQFLDEIILKKILEIAKENDKNIHFFGLLTTFTGDYFKGSYFLLKTIEPSKITELDMTCQYEDCSFLAEYNARIVNGKVARNGDTFLEEKSKYLAYCKKHYFS